MRAPRRRPGRPAGRGTRSAPGSWDDPERRRPGVRADHDGAADDGHRLDPVPARWPYAFVRQDDHGPDAFLTAPE
ncbi:hypothetical protein BRD05_07460 [Halobacteriales archaeon QS_9_70_65]|nr:MAG: hypothetical protein BRD05_07460 [Halobacteriales archaeon QS_9_70_65]